MDRPSGHCQNAGGANTDAADQSGNSVIRLPNTSEKAIDSGGSPATRGTHCSSAAESASVIAAVTVSNPMKVTAPTGTSRVIHATASDASSTL